jgi:hypothetical protein
VQRWGLLRMAIPRNIRVSKVVALVIALAKIHNFCIDESNVTKQLPLMDDRDRFHVMNADGGYVSLSNDDPQQTTCVPTELMHRGMHFIDIPDNVLRAHRRHREVTKLPQTVLFQMIADEHWQRPTRVGNGGG